MVFAPYRTLTYYMFPFTPIELHEGYVIGEERIITAKSGLYGWRDASGHRIHVFDEFGMEVVEFAAPVVR